MKVKLLDEQGKERTANLSLFQRLQLFIQGYAFHRWKKKEGWKDYLPIYIVKCKRHGLFLDYPHGFRGYFICPKCVLEERQKRSQKDS